MGLFRPTVPTWVVRQASEWNGHANGCFGEQATDRLRPGARRFSVRVD